MKTLLSFSLVSESSDDTSEESSSASVVYDESESPRLLLQSSVLSATESPLPSPGTQIGDLTLANGGGDLAFPGGSFVLHSILGSSLGFQIFSNNLCFIPS